MLQMQRPSQSTSNSNAISVEVKSADTRQAILLAALHQFAEAGFSKTSTRNIALQAGANIGSIAYHFGDKAGLYRALFRELPEHFGIKSINPGDFEALRQLPLEQILDRYYSEFTEIWFGPECDRAAIKLWFREMVEPTGEGQHYLESQVRPKHEFLEAMLMRELGNSELDEGVQSLAQFVIALGSHLVTCEDVWRMHSPSLIGSPEKLTVLRQRMVSAAMAMVEAERSRRVEIKK